METFGELSQKFGSAVQIPNDILYDYIKRPDVWASLKNYAGLGLERLKETAIVQEVRRRSIEDLYWLARYFLWETMPECRGRAISENLINEHTHRRVCDLFVKKNANKTLGQQDQVSKERLLLYPRGAFKSTLDACDTVQWILVFPDIRILFLTADDELAAGFADAVKSHFLSRPMAPSMMNLFFPEYCVEEKDLGKIGFFNCPLWTARNINRVEPTLMSSSIVSTLSGFHFDVLKADDTVSNRNSENDVQCKKVIKNFAINRKMLMPYGYLDRIGTRYHEEDMYGDVLRKNVGNVKVEKGPCWETTYNFDTGLKTLVGRAWQVKPEIQAKLDNEVLKENGAPFSYSDLKEEDYDLIFPENLSYRFLRKEQNDNEEVFESQYNQDPRPPIGSITFPKTLLLKRTVPFQSLPTFGPITITWDFAFSKKKGRDYSTAVAAMWNEKGQCFIVDMIRARFSPDALAQAIVDFAKKWRPMAVGIEKASGSELLEPTIIRKAEETNLPEVRSVCGRLDWFKTSTQLDAKRVRMSTLHPWLVNERLFFASYLPFLNILYEEFQTCMSGYHHDDIPDVISYQLNYAPQMQRTILKNEVTSYTRADAAFNILFEEADCFGRIGAGPTPPPMLPEPEQNVQVMSQHPDLNPILGAGVVG